MFIIPICLCSYSSFSQKTKYISFFFCGKPWDVRIYLCTLFYYYIFHAPLIVAIDVTVSDFCPMRDILFMIIIVHDCVWLDEAFIYILITWLMLMAWLQMQTMIKFKRNENRKTTLFLLVCGLCSEVLSRGYNFSMFWKKDLRNLFASINYVYSGKHFGEKCHLSNF